MNCKLCKRKPAEQTGSHITSAFLLTSQIGNRGEEQAFLITTDPNQDYSENQGDTGIKEDNIFCRDCEKRLGFIENSYSVEITQKIEEARFKQNFISVSTKHGTFLRCLRVNSIAFSLLVYSNIWRASLSNLHLYAHFKLSAEVEEEIRFLLDLFLPETVNHKVDINFNSWLKIVENCKDYFTHFPFIILKAEKLNNKTITFQFYDNISRSPNHIILNEYIILSFFEGTQWNDDLLSFKNELKYTDLVNDKYEEPKIGIISNQRYMQIIEMFSNMAILERISNIDMLCVEELKMKGVPVTPENIKICRMAKVAEISPDNEGV